MTTSRKSGSPSKRGEAEFWKSWQKPITIDEVAAKHEVPPELKGRLQELLEQAHRNFRENEQYVASITSEGHRAGRKLLTRLAEDVQKLRVEWQERCKQSPHVIEAIDYHACAFEPWITYGTGKPGELAPDCIGAFLGRTEKALKTVSREMETMRSDSTYSWQESLESLVCFYVDELQRPLSGSFSDHETDLPKELEKQLKHKQRYAESPDDYFYPVPSHDSQWFLYDCMRHISQKDADTIVLRSLLKAHWMPDGPVYEEGHSGDFFRVDQRQTRKTRKPKSRS